MKILMATGGTGGHIFPAIATALALRYRGHKVEFAGTLGTAEAKINALGFTAHGLRAQGFNSRSLGSMLSFGWLMMIALGQSRAIVRRVAADKVIGFGGYGSFPIVLAAIWMNYPTMIHEQNVVPGKANALLARWVRLVAISFKESAFYFKHTKTVWAGCPCHQEVFNSKRIALEAFGLVEGPVTLMLLGGSQGSQKLNQVFFELMAAIGPSGKFQAIHMTGVKEYGDYEARYQAAGLPVKVCAFISAMHHAYAAADVVIARAGAATVSELGVLGIASVLVPYPFAGGHQRYNADVLAKAGTAMIIEQDQLTMASLKRAVDRLLVADISRQRNKQKTQGLFQPDAALQLALAVEGL